MRSSSDIIFCSNSHDILNSRATTVVVDGRYLMNIWRNAAPFAKIFKLILAQIRDSDLTDAPDFFLKIISMIDQVVKLFAVTQTVLTVVT